MIHHPGDVVEGVREVLWWGRVAKPRLSVSGLKEKIEQALLRRVKTDAERITVEVDGTRVTLKRAVRSRARSRAERQEAERAAWMAPGVTSVENRITISYY
jgi:osmotically-inducible protein OsmY